MPNQPDYRLTLRPLASDVPAVIRLRSVLKRLLRTYQFRAVVVEEVRAEADADVPAGRLNDDDVR
jgi:hypothetical protein